MLKWEMYTEEEAWKSVGANEQLLLELVDKLRQWLKQQAHLPQGLYFEIQATLSHQSMVCYIHLL